MRRGGRVLVGCWRRRWMGRNVAARPDGRTRLCADAAGSVAVRETTESGRWRVTPDRSNVNGRHLSEELDRSRMSASSGPLCWSLHFC